jgi:hypothetical protein
MRRLAKSEVLPAVRTCPVFVRETTRPKRFNPGDEVVVSNINPLGHTRLPRYARGRVGVVQEYRGSFLLPDTSAHHLGDNAQHLYNVKFTARNLWGSEASAIDHVYIDLFDDYIHGLAREA